MSLQSFFESTAGQVVSAAVIVLVFVGILISGRGKKFDTRVMVASAILIALSIVLHQITLWRMLQGGSVTAFSLLPVAICGYFFGVRRGVMAGICVGLLSLLFDPYVVHPAQMLLDYPLAYGALGLAGLFQNKKHGLLFGYPVGVMGMYLCAILSGVIFFGSYTPEGSNVLVYSLIYNGSYLLPEVIITMVLIAIPPVNKTLLRIKNMFVPSAMPPLKE